MPLWVATVEKYYAGNGEYWTNIYHFNADSGAPAKPVFDAFVNAEKPLYVSGITITKCSVRSKSELDPAHHTEVYNVPGTRVSPGGDFGPLFVTGRVDFTVSWSHPSRKYLRGVLWEADFAFQTLSAGIVTILQTYGTAILNIAGICDAQGQVFSGAVPFTSPQMRQLRRGSKKKVIP